MFHASTWLFTVAGLAILWRHARQPHARWSARLLAGTMLMGFGIFDVVEGIIDHALLGLHHVNETVPPEQWLWWDLGFLAWGALMLVGAAILAHAVSGWYPLLPVLRRLGVRTAREIEEERRALASLLQEREA